MLYWRRPFLNNCLIYLIFFWKANKIKYILWAKDSNKSQLVEAKISLLDITKFLFLLPSFLLNPMSSSKIYCNVIDLDFHINIWNYHVSGSTTLLLLSVFSSYAYWRALKWCTFISVFNFANHFSFEEQNERVIVHCTSGKLFTWHAHNFLHCCLFFSQFFSAFMKFEMVQLNKVWHQWLSQLVFARKLLVNKFSFIGNFVPGTE